MTFYDLSQRGLAIARYVSRHAFQRTHRVVNSSGKIGIRPPREGLQCFVQVFRRCESFRCFLNGSGLCYHRLECFRSARDDLPIRELPANSFFDKKLIQGFRELHGVGFALLLVVFCHFRVQRLDNVVDLEPLAAVHEPLNFVPDIGIRPVARLGRLAQYPAQRCPQCRRPPVEFPCFFQDEVAQFPGHPPGW